MEKLSISVVIPAYNEEKRIGKTLKRLSSYLSKKKYDYEIIVVDDGSRDKTVQVAKSFANKKLRILKNRENMGKGASVRKGMLAARKKFVLFSDSDLSTPIEEIGGFMKLRKKYDVIIGSRALKGSKIKIKQPFYRVLMGKVFNLFVNLLVVWGIKDTQCGFKLFKRDAAQKIFKKQSFNGFGFDVEVLFIAKKLGYRIREMPVVWINSPDTKVSAVKDSIMMFVDLLRIRVNGLRGKYG
jgi:dolichyl-phosphate beta-glucosyltransferase